MAQGKKSRRGSDASRPTRKGTSRELAEKDISQDETLAMESGETNQLAIARHRLRAAAHRIVSDCDRMLGDMERPERQIWRDSVGEALLAGRHLASLIDRRLNSSVPPSGRLTTLYQEIRDPQRRIVRSMTALLSLIPTGLEEELMLQDARAIRETAIGLLATDKEGTGEQAVAPVSFPGRRSGVGNGAERPRPRLLVVDDDEAPRRALSRLLQRLGYDVTVAEHGRQALEIAERQPLDLIVTDITMPEMDGYELLARLKAHERTRHIPVIVVSGVDDVHSVVRCIEQGAEDHLTKPYETVLLQARVRASLERKRMRDLELAYLGRVAQLTAAAEAVEHQSYEAGTLAGLAQETDELGQLARVFDRMVSGIRSREEHLELRLRQLRREIRQVSNPGRLSGAISGESPFAAGQVLADRYEIREELGKGGMGMVYLAHDRKLAEDVAVKVVRRELVGQDPNLFERLKSEMRLARRISHRNVVRAHDLGEWEGVYFLTMEYVRGISLAELLNTRGRLTVESTLAIGAQLADALTVAHEQNIIHRDIKPANLLVDEEGVLKVMDFGLARLVQHTGELTQAGFVVGTPRYMAPEQLFGGDMDARSDLFAVGIVFYECLTGKPPFEASSPLAVVAKMLEGRTPPVRELSPDVPTPLSLLIERLLQRDPNDRIKSARELGEQLNQIGRSYA
jgi:CheY-like chemotaxis protein/predicted Ser/Thr protein kinase